MSLKTSRTYFGSKTNIKFRCLVIAKPKLNKYRQLTQVYFLLWCMWHHIAELRRLSEGCGANGWECDDWWEWWLMRPCGQVASILIRVYWFKAVATIGASHPPPIGLALHQWFLITDYSTAIAKILLLIGRFDSYAKMYLYVLLFSFTYTSLDKILTEVLITQFTQCM